MKIAVQLDATADSPADVDYTWDPDTDILSARLTGRESGVGMSGSVGLEGTDGSWVILDLRAGRITAVEVAVWPEVRRLDRLDIPADVASAGVLIPARKSQPDVASMEMSTQLAVDADRAQRTFHFRLGRPKDTRTVRLAKDVLLDVDGQSHIAGVWLLNVPPCPVQS